MMPWIPFYTAEDDLVLLNEILRSDEDLSLLSHQAGDHWRALLDYRLVEDGRYSLWHVAGGPLPLLHESHLGEAFGEVADPFDGWRQVRVGEDGQPWLGNAPNILHLNLRVTRAKPGNSFGMSSIEWIGNHFSAIGRAAPEATAKRWDKLRRQFTKLGPRVPRGWLARDRKPEVFALPQAYALLTSGAKGDVDPI